MRRWSGILAAFSLMALMGTGCGHTAGVCDCDPGIGHHPPPVGHPPIIGAHHVEELPHNGPVVPGIAPHYAAPLGAAPAAAAAPAPRMMKATN